MTDSALKSWRDGGGGRPPAIASDHHGGINEGINNMSRDSERTDPKRKPRYPRLEIQRRRREIDEELHLAEDGEFFHMPSQR